MNIVYALLAFATTAGLVTALRPKYGDENTEHIADGAMIVGACGVGLIVFLALAVGS